ncbi:ATP-binding protein [Streptomyces boncukensis]|uniref:ATP-binding protein n=1 Tax=Streptomyces boncukensis TaxID=2711219 RepID=A0A6G4WUU1_9ACTN|nr:ATP-binding protein [Streptomyces boncukensis]NGO69046.1 ATP-binding protein [Streptomyces boncukensis]
MNEAIPATYRLTAPNIPGTAKVARDMVAALTQATGHPALADTARLLVSEVVSNVHLHTDVPTLQLAASVSGDPVLVSVEDREIAGAPPLVRTVPEGERGRGLLLVRECAKAWGVTRWPDSKRVWFELYDNPA